MRVLLLANPVSGGGRALGVAEVTRAALRAKGIDGRVVKSVPGEEGRLRLREDLDGCDALVVLGGDGSVRGAAEACIELGKPLYPMPLGTESLFARSFGLTTAPEQLIQALRVKQVRSVDVAQANGERFLIMASVGFDAEVVHDLSERRTGPIQRVTYLLPILRAITKWRAPSCRVAVDGKPAEPMVPGTLVMANLRAYAARLDLVWWACADDGLLDGMVIPARTAVGVAVGAVKSWMRSDPRPIPGRTWRGRTVIIESDSAFRFQVDGDAPRARAPVRRLELSVGVGQLRVLVPAPRQENP